MQEPSETILECDLKVVSAPVSIVKPAGALLHYH